MHPDPDKRTFSIVSNSNSMNVTLILFYFLLQVVPEDPDASSSDDDIPEDPVHDGDEGLQQQDDEEEEEDDEDRLVTNSSEQLDTITFEDGQLVDGYNFRYLKHVINFYIYSIIEESYTCRCNK